MISCSSHVYDLPTGVGNRSVLWTGVDSLTWYKIDFEDDLKEWLKIVLLIRLPEVQGGRFAWAMDSTTNTTIQHCSRTNVHRRAFSWTPYKWWNLWISLSYCWHLRRCSRQTNRHRLAEMCLPQCLRSERCGMWCRECHRFEWECTSFLWCCSLDKSIRSTGNLLSLVQLLMSILWFGAFSSTILRVVMLLQCMLKHLITAKLCILDYKIFHILHNIMHLLRTQ